MIANAKVACDEDGAPGFTGIESICMPHENAYIDCVQGKSDADAAYDG